MENMDGSGIMNPRNHAEDSVYAQAAFDSPANQKSRSNKKRQAIIDTWQEPVWPKLSKILFISMIVLTTAMALVEVKNALTGASFELRRFLSNLSVTLVWVWGIHTVLLSLCCLMGSRANRLSYERRKAESGIRDATDEERARSKRAVSRLNAVYTRYLRVALIGLAIVLLLYCVIRIL